MKIKVCYTVELSDNDRRALNAFYGKPGMMSKETIQDLLRDVGYGETFNNMIYDNKEK
jgi:hypothetical protein